MRINKFIAQHTNLSRRKADAAIDDGRIEINGILAKAGDIVVPTDTVTLDSHDITPSVNTLTLILNKPVGYVVSRNGQGSQTIYDILPKEFHHLNPVGRLDKNSSGLLLMTNDGNLANELTHPSFSKQKIYIVELYKLLSDHDHKLLSKGVDIGDKTVSRLDVRSTSQTQPIYEIKMSEGRNRQIRRTFAALGYKVRYLHRIEFGPYKLNDLQPGKYRELPSQN